MIKKSSFNQKKYKTIKMIEVLIASMIPIIVPFANSSLFIRILVGLLGGAIIFLVGLQGICNYYQNWIEYRGVAETLKREKILYESKAGIYKNLDFPFTLLVERVEGILSRENNNWFELNKLDKNKTG